MSEDDFWQHIDRVHVEAIAKSRERDDAAAHVRALRAELRDVSPPGLLDFNTQFVTAMCRAYRYDLWGFFWLAFQGCGDDSFSDARCWLISRGREAYEIGLRNPDDLVTYVSFTPGGPSSSWTGFDAAVGEVYRERTGEDLPLPAIEHPRKPVGESKPWQRSEEAVRASYPRTLLRVGPDTVRSLLADQG